MSALNADEFDAFFNEVHRYPPFPWQSRLAARVLKEGRFPALLDLPTGSGKTAAIDVAVFALAADSRAVESRRLPCRIAFVVDRRTVVDQSFKRAEKLADALEAAVPGSVTYRVAERLRQLAGTDAPLHVSLLRGAVPRDDTWYTNPTQPTVLVSTVDQVGSRLFFRGYGVSEGMRPIHAGLLGNDLLLLLDEVHLARPFCDTLRMLERYHAERTGKELPRRFQVAELSATHRGGDHAEPFRLETDDRENERLNRRITARKPTKLKLVKVSGGEPARLAALARKIAAVAADEVRPGRAIGVVVNRIQTARLVYQALCADGLDADVSLLTGRMRPLDRQALEKELEVRFATGRERDPKGRPAILISTQCIEAGADFDFDLLLTECASLDALRQRFGRLNRAGDVDDAAGIVFARSDVEKTDPIYGDAAASTWAYLNGLPDLDFGSEALSLPTPDELGRMLAPSTTSPILLPAYLDAWCQTAPAPYPDPDVALWLHGPQEPIPDVLVVWRADVGEQELEEAVGEDADGDALGSNGRALAERVDACPPLTSEAMAVPVWAAKAWLAGERESDAELADVDGGILASETDTADGRPVVIRRNGQFLVGRPNDIRAWDTVIVPVEYGGIRDGNWDPDAQAAVVDHAEAAHLRQRGRAILRLDERLWFGASPPEPSQDDEQTVDDKDRLKEFLEARSGAGAEQPWSDIRAEVIGYLLAELQGRPGPRFVTVKGRDGSDRWVLISRRTYTSARRAPGLTGADLVPDDDALSFVGTGAPLGLHLRGVGAIAESFARRCGLSESLTHDLRLAGELHDIGKHDRRFQQMLQGGSEYRALTAPEPLAKSSVSNRNRRLSEEARRRADYPAGTRHELISLALLRDADTIRAKAHDWELVQHLVASHHGHCRPFAPVEPEPRSEPIAVEASVEGIRLRASTAHGLAAVDSGVSDRFFALSERYGCYGLAWLEAILRLADHRRSEIEEGGAL